MRRKKKKKTINNKEQEGDEYNIPKLSVSISKIKTTDSMAKWNTISLKEVIKEISSGRIVLPVIQRELVWETEKMTALLKQY